MLVGKVGSVDTVSQLLSWNQAPGLPRTVSSMAAATVESRRSGLNRMKPFAWAADMSHRLSRSGRCLWLTDLGYLCGREIGKCVFSGEFPLAPGSEIGGREQSHQHFRDCGLKKVKWVRASRVGSGLGDPVREVEAE